MAQAQTNEEIFREYQFNFSAPGARANGMGGAFIGLADDATSSFANPAGLAYLNETAFTLDYRYRDIEGSTGTVGGFLNTTDPVDFKDVAFVSVNFRYEGWYFGLYQHSYLDEHQEREFSLRSLDNGVETAKIRDIFLDLEGHTLGLGLARRFGSWKLGLSLNHVDLVGETRYERSGFTFGNVIQSELYNSNIDDRDHDWGYSLGIHKEIGTSFSWGAVWRDNPRFRLKENILGEENGLPVFLEEDLPVPFVVPDVLGVGVRWRVIPPVSVLADWQRIFYSSVIEDGFTIVENAPQDPSDYTTEDSDEFHVGMEWLLPGENNVWAVRAGYYRNPLHTVSYNGDDDETQSRFAQTGLSNEDHVTVGVGWVFRNRLEIDLSANFWERGQEVTASFIWRRK